MTNNAYLRTAGLLILGVIIGVAGHWLLVITVEETHVPFYSDTVTDLVTGEEGGELLLNGTWRLTSEEKGYTGESIIISCRRGAMQCAVASAVVYLGGGFDNQITHMKVTEWSTEGRIVATVTGACTTHLLTIESPEAVTLTTTPIEGMPEDCGTLEEQTGTWELVGTQPTPASYWKGEFHYSLYDLADRIRGK